MTRKTDLPAIPAALADVAMIDAPTCAAVGGFSLSAWYDLVRAGAAPAPAIRAPRFTRWRLADIRTWLIERAEAGSDPKTAEAAQASAIKASAAAKVKRNATNASLEL